jgi:serine/threonine protein kinase
MKSNDSHATNKPVEDDYDDPRLVAAMQEYVAGLEAGRAPSRREMLAKHPEIARELADCLSGLQFMRAAAPGIKEVDDETKLAELQVRNDDPDISVEDARPLGDFRLIREIGRGGMGVVYEAMQLSLGRRVAVKVLSMAAALDQRQLQRFRNEAQAAAQLHHTNIVPVYAVGCERSVHFYAMQLIEGRSLAQLIATMRKMAREESEIDDDRTQAVNDPPKPAAPAKELPFSRSLEVEPSTVSRSLISATRSRSLSAADDAINPASIAGLHSRRRQSFFRTVARLGVQAAEALDYAHRAGVIHRDVKPANLLLDDAGTLWITDFGLAQLQSDQQLTQAGETVGTLQYMSPEQASGRAVLLDQRTDIYSLGVTLYELLTLERAYSGQTREALLNQIQNQDPRPPRAIDKTIPPELETIITTALAKEPAERYSNARAMADDLLRYLRDEPILARKPSLRSRALKWGRRHRSLVAGTVVVSILAAVGSIVAAVLIAAEQAKTSAAYDRERERLVEANNQRARAEKSFGQARDAVTFLSRVATDDLADIPQASAVRREMLETVLDYHQGFLEEHREDRAVSGQIADAEANVAAILAELSAFDDLDRVQSKLRLLSDPAIRTELSLTDAQVEKARQLSQGFPAKMREAFTRAAGGDEESTVSDSGPGAPNGPGGPGGPGGGKSRGMWDMPTDKRREVLSGLAKDAEQQLLVILSAKQIERLSQIARQIRGPIAFGDPDVQTPLALSREQREMVRRVQAESRKAQREFQRHGPWDHRPDSGEQAKAVRQNAVDQIVAGLTVVQKQKWQSLKGESFTAALTPEWSFRGQRRPMGNMNRGGPDGGKDYGPDGNNPNPPNRQRPNDQPPPPRDGFQPGRDIRDPHERDPHERPKNDRSKPDGV